MLSSPRSPSSTIRIFSSAENRRRVFRRMSCTTFSGVVVLLPSLPIGILLPWLRSVSYSSARRGLTDSDAKHLLTPAEALKLRARKKGEVILRSVLEQQLEAINQFEYRGQTHKFDRSAIEEGIRGLTNLGDDGL